MPTPTYTPLANITLGSAASSVTFSSISGAYRDLVLVYNGQMTSNANFSIRLNGDTGTNYSHVMMQGPTNSGSGTYSFIYGYWNLALNSTRQTLNASFMDYSATDKHKTILNRAGYTREFDSAFTVEAQAYRWPNTSAITTMLIYVSAGNFATGSSFALYGIVA
jgi:hypothetical protein